MAAHSRNTVWHSEIVSDGHVCCVVEQSRATYTSLLKGKIPHLVLCDLITSHPCSVHQANQGLSSLLSGISHTLCHSQVVAWSP